jgi:hypothetical protein
MDELATVLRRVPVLDLLCLVGSALALKKWGWPNPPTADEPDRERRAASAEAITNQVNAILTSASILLAAVGALLAIAFDKPELPKAAREHLLIAAAEALLAIPLGVLYARLYPFCDPPVGRSPQTTGNDHLLCPDQSHHSIGDKIRPCDVASRSLCPNFRLIDPQLPTLKRRWLATCH